MQADSERQGRAGTGPGAMAYRKASVKGLGSQFLAVVVLQVWWQLGASALDTDKILSAI